MYAGLRLASQQYSVDNFETRDGRKKKREKKKTRTAGLGGLKPGILHIGAWSTCMTWHIHGTAESLGWMEGI